MVYDKCIKNDSHSRKAEQIPGVTKYLPRGLQYGSGQLDNYFKCQKYAEFNFWSNKTKSKAIASEVIILQKFP